MRFFRILMLSAFIIPLFAACKKDESTPALTQTEMLTGGKWRLTALTVSPAYLVNGTSITDVFSTYPTCTKDDFQSFATTGAYSYDESTDKCPDSNQTETGTWKWNTDETELTLTTSSYSDVWEIKNLSSKSMTSIYKVAEGGVVYTFTGTLTKSN
jgi:hypothetical protein